MGKELPPLAEQLRLATEARAKAELELDLERSARHDAEGRLALGEVAASRRRRMLASFAQSRLSQTTAAVVRGATRPAWARRDHGPYWSIPPDAPADLRNRLAGEQRRRRQAERAWEAERAARARADWGVRALEQGPASLLAAAEAAVRAASGSRRASASGRPTIAIRTPTAPAITAVVTGGCLAGLATALLLAVRGWRDPPMAVAMAPARSGATTGPATAAAVGRSRSPLILISRAGYCPSRRTVRRLAELLAEHPPLGAAFAGDVDWSFDWAGDRPTVERGSGARPSTPAAIGADCVMVRAEAVDAASFGVPYGAVGWSVEQSLGMLVRGWEVAMDDAPPRSETPAGSFSADVSTLARRWGPALRRHILGDALKGGDRWCARGARVALGQRAASLAGTCVRAGWTVTSREVADFELDASETEGLTVRWAPCGPTVPACTGQPPPSDAAALEALVRSTLEVESVAFAVGARTWEAARSGGDHQLARALTEALGRRGHPAGLELATRELSATSSFDALVVLRGRHPVDPDPGRLNLLWQISHPEEIDASEYLAFDGLLVASRPYCRALAGQLPIPVRPFLQFTDPRIFHPEPDPRFEHDLAFVGNWRSVYRRVVWDALTAGLRPALYGTGWDRLAPEVAARNHVPPEDLRRIYSSCGVLLNDHWDDMRRDGFISNRIFDALACEAFVISDDCAGLADELRGTVETYVGADGLGVKVRNYLDKPDERALRARAGRELVLSRHTADHRAKELIAALEEAGSRCRRPEVLGSARAAAR